MGNISQHWRQGLKVLKIGLVGASGKMGRAIVSLVKKQYKNSVQLVWTPNRQELNAKIATWQSKPQIIIDFSLPEATMLVSTLAKKHKIPLLVCTTGFSPSQLKKLKATLRTSKWSLVSNTSVGVFMFHKIIASLGKNLPEHYKLSMEETHHIHKKDKPSGTAKSLKESVLKATKRKNLSVKSIRQGEVFGIHNLIISGPNESLTISHHANNRNLFAQGAIELAIRLKKQRGTSYINPEKIFC